MARISVFGIGYVGVVAAACLARDGHRVIAVDVDTSKIDAINAGRSPIVEEGLDELVAEVVASGALVATGDVEMAIKHSDASFVCVGTPSGPDGSVGLTYVKAACAAIGNAIAHKQTFHSVVVRSTIVPGTTMGVCVPILSEASGLTAGEGFGVGYFPEFLRESTAIADYDDPGLIVVGALDYPTRKFLLEVNAKLPCKTHAVDVSTAEMVKYTSNSWRAVKVTFANEIGNIAKSSGLDGQEVMKILCTDTKVNISPYFMRPGFAFGGSCLPKDVRALRALADETGVGAPLLNAVLEANDAQIRRAERMVADSGARQIGLIGISFKPGTDDLRESPLAELASRLVKNGHDVIVYDPFVYKAHAQDPANAGRGNDVLPDLQSRLVADVNGLIDTADAIVVGNLYPDVREPLAAAVGTKPMVDLTRLRSDLVSGQGYDGICW